MTQIAFWRLEEATGATRVDCVGNNNLTDNFNVAQIAGHIGNAAHFTRASTQSLDILDNADMSVEGGVSFTFACWVYLDSKPGGSIYLPIINKNAIGLGGQYYLMYQGNFGSRPDRFFFSALTTPATAAVANTLGSPSLSTWYFIICWYNAATETAGICVDNGTPDTTTVAGATPIAADTSPFELGHRATQFFDGRIDAVGFWKRVLTSEERTTLWNSGIGLEPCSGLSSYSFTPSGAGLPDQAIDVDGNGDILYLGLYDANADPILLTVPIPLVGGTSTATRRYAPGAGDAINVKAHYLVGDFSIIAGHFGNNEQARRSEDAGVTYSDIDPSTWAANRAQPIAIDPNDEEHVLLALDTNDDLVEKDSADAWATLDAALPYDVGAMAIYDLDPNEIVIARINAGALMVEYSPNNGVSWGDITGTLPITDGIASLELV